MMEVEHYRERDLTPCSLNRARMMQRSSSLVTGHPSHRDESLDRLRSIADALPPVQSPLERSASHPSGGQFWNQSKALVPVDTPQPATNRSRSTPRGSKIPARRLGTATPTAVRQRLPMREVATSGGDPRITEERGVAVCENDKDDSTSIKNYQEKVEGIKTKPGIVGRCFGLLWLIFRCIAITWFLAVCAYGMGLLSSKTYTNWCESRISLNLTKLHQDLSGRVYGQHIAVNIVYHAISDFASESTENRHTPLVLSFHGWTGSGKNHISTLLAESIPTQSVHRYLIPWHFPHREQSDKYEENIPAWIQGNLTKCAINLIIFDEMDKANSGVLAGLRETLIKLREAKLNNTKVIFLLLSNSGGYSINRHLLDSLELGIKRSALNASQLIRDTINKLLHDPQAEWFQTLYDMKVIRHFVPFLPLEKSHVKRCIETDLKEKGHAVKSEMVDHIADQFQYFPDWLPVFSKTGCKQVTSKVDLSLE